MIKNRIIKELIVLGDFNCRNSLWKDSTTNHNGKRLEQFVNLHQLACIFPNSKTFVCGDGGSVIDLALINNGKLSDLYKTSSVDSDIELFTGAPTRGHLPVIHNFKLPSALSNASKFPTTIYKDIKSGKLSTEKKDKGTVFIEESELARLYGTPIPKKKKEQAEHCVM